MRVNSISQYNNYTKTVKRQNNSAKFHNSNIDNQVKVNPAFKANGCAKSAVLLGLGALLAPATYGISGLVAVALFVLADLHDIFNDDDDD